MDRNYNPEVQKPMRIFLQGLHLANKEGALPSTTDQMKRKTASKRKKALPPCIDPKRHPVLTQRWRRFPTPAFI
jgi:hypothetical protein